MSSIPAKDVIYIDVDDEITTIIDKVRGSQSKILALVLPKRATTLQSIVNMKLLKRSADEGGKHLVLITGEAGLMPLAANVGLYVAKNLQSKPEVPHVPQAVAELPDDFEESISLDDPTAKTVKPSLDSSAAVGDLARGSMPPSSLDDAIDLDNSTKDTNPIMRSIPTTGMGAVVGDHSSDAAKGAATAAKGAGKKNKKLAVPNFDKFRMWLIVGGGALVLLIFLWVIAFKVMPRASVLVKTNSTAVNANVSLTLNTSATQVNADGGVVPAQSQQTQKSLTATSGASGQRNDGQKASGTITIVNCSDKTVTLPAGTGFSTNGLTFISTDKVSVPQSDYKMSSGGFSCKNDGTASVGVIAQSAGEKYNVGSATYSIAGGPSNVQASGQSMSGGTDQITKILQQSDIDAAKQKISSQDTNAVKQQLQNQLTNMGLNPIPATFTASTPDISTTANAGDQVDSVTVTEKLTYTMLGAKQSDLKKIVASAIKDKVDTSKQTITDYGLGAAQYTTQDASSGSVTMAVTAVVGPDIKVESLRKQVAGKKTGDAKQIIKSNPGVTDVTINYSPFWVSSIPGSESKITVTIEKPHTTTNAN